MNELQPHQQRVVDEQAELDKKILALCIFIAGKIYKTLPKDEQDRLFKQKELMCGYSDILGERIAAFW